MWSIRKMNAFFYSFRISATMRITLWFWQNLQNNFQTNPLHAIGMLQCYSVSLKKWVQLWMCHNLGGFVWRQCGRIWKMEPPLQWKMRTPPHITYPQYLDRSAKCSNTRSTTFTNHISFLITLFHFWFTRFFPSFFTHANWGTDFCRTLYYTF